ncbi:hypothetical protein [Nitrospira sp. Nam74]
MDEYGMWDIRPEDVLPYLFGAAPDWHSFKHFDVERQARFLLEQAENQQEYELAMYWTRLKGKNPKTIRHTLYTEILAAVAEDDDCPPFLKRPASQSRYDIEESLFRDRFFMLTPSELKMFHHLRRRAWEQQRAAETWITRLQSLDLCLSRTFEATNHYLGGGAEPIVCIRVAYDGFEHFVRRQAGNNCLRLTDEAALTKSFPDLAPWVRDYIIEAGIHADDEKELVPEIERDKYFLLFLMAAVAAVLTRPADAALCYPLFEMPFVGKVQSSPPNDSRIMNYRR